jgi:hypothetical protein
MFSCGHDVVVACNLAMVDVRVRFSLAALMSKFRLILIAAILLTSAAMFAVPRYLPKHESRSHREATYFIDVEYEKVKKILVRTDSMPEIVEYQHGELLFREWKSLSLSSDKLFQGWQVEGSGEFVVRTNDPETGTLELRFRQKILISESGARIEADLVQPVGSLIDYRTVMDLRPSNGGTEVSNSITIVYARRLPSTYVEYMDSKVAEATKQGLQRSEQAMRNLVNKYKDKKFIIPIK